MLVSILPPVARNPRFTRITHNTASPLPDAVQLVQIVDPSRVL